jgi:hypothetical protein
MVRDWMIENDIQNRFKTIKPLYNFESDIVGIITGRITRIIKEYDEVQEISCSEIHDKQLNVYVEIKVFPYKNGYFYEQLHENVNDTDIFKVNDYIKTYECFGIHHTDNPFLKYNEDYINELVELSSELGKREDYEDLTF